jgi:hypothetical protein
MILRIARDAILSVAAGFPRVASRQSSFFASSMSMMGMSSRIS